MRFRLPRLLRRNKRKMGLMELLHELPHYYVRSEYPNEWKGMQNSRVPQRRAFP